MIPEFVMFIGIPGCGKSTWLKKHKPDTHIVVCPDKIREELTGDISDQSINIEAWKEAYSRIIDALNSGFNVILDSTNLDVLHRKNLLKSLPECTLKAVVFEVEPEEAFRRISNAINAGENRSMVPEHVVYRYYGDFLYTNKVLKSEGFAVEFAD